MESPRGKPLMATTYYVEIRFHGQIDLTGGRCGTRGVNQANQLEVLIWPSEHQPHTAPTPESVTEGETDRTGAFGPVTQSPSHLCCL